MPLGRIREACLYMINYRSESYRRQVTLLSKQSQPQIQLIDNGCKDYRDR